MILIMQIWCLHYFQLKRPLNSEKNPHCFHGLYYINIFVEDGTNV